MKRAGVALSSAAALAMVLAACGEKPAESGSDNASGSGSFNACMVLDTGGVDDHSFNQSSYAGMQAAKEENPDIAISYVPSNSQNDYVPNLNAAVAKGCDTTIAVGGLMADALKSVAAANPDAQFAEVDAPSTGENVYGLQFDTAQGAFLGGYLAAGMTKTGTVATFGGLNIPPVTIYMDGFWEGVQHYNEQKGTSVKVLGWDETDQKGRHHLPGRRWRRARRRGRRTGLERRGQRHLGRHRRLRVLLPVLPVLHHQRDEEPLRCG
jgi:basic membrane protein A